jgi:hypothetical protein
MISDEPDEDADTIDDEGLLQTYANAALPVRASGSGKAADAPEWPLLRRTPEAWTEIDVKTSAWFKGNRADWQAELRGIVRGWVAAQILVAPGNRPPA